MAIWILIILVNRLVLLPECRWCWPAWPRWAHIWHDCEQTRCAPMRSPRSHSPLARSAMSVRWKARATFRCNSWCRTGQIFKHTNHRLGTIVFAVVEKQKQKTNINPPILLEDLEAVNVENANAIATKRLGACLDRFVHILQTNSVGVLTSQSWMNFKILISTSKGYQTTYTERCVDHLNDPVEGALIDVLDKSVARVHGLLVAERRVDLLAACHVELSIEHRFDHRLFVQLKHLN